MTGLDIRRLVALRGPNVWARFPVLEVWVDLGPLKDKASDELPGFNGRLKRLLPSLVEHRCSVGERGGFFQRLDRGTYLAHIFEHVVLELQTLAGTDVGYGKTRMTYADGVYKVGIEYDDEEMARAACDLGREVCLAAVNDTPIDVAAGVERLKAILEKNRLTPAVADLLAAAHAARVPATVEDAGGLVRLGWGANQRRVLNGQTDRASAIGVSMAADPDLFRPALQAAGVPVADPDTSAPGGEYRLLVVGDRLVSAVDAAGADVTAAVHPEVAARAADSAFALKLDVAAVTVVTADIAQPLEAVGGVVAGLSAQPDLTAFPGPVGKALVDALYPESRQARVPVVAVTGTNGKTTTTRLVAHLLAQRYGTVGLTCTDGIYVGDRRVDTGDCSGPKSAKFVLRHPAVQAAALETARGGILREGLGFDRCDVAVVTNIEGGDHLGMADIETPEELADVKSTIVWAVASWGTAVLNAADPLVVAMRRLCDGAVTYFVRDPETPVVVEHRSAGGKAVVMRDNAIVLADGAAETVLISLARVPLTHGGLVAFQVENVLAAAAAAWAAGVPLDLIRRGLETFASTLDQVPGRFNLFEVNGVTVVLDYGHNTSSLVKLIDTLKALPHPRRHAVYSAAGDRRDADMVEQGKLLGDFFDRVVVYEDSCIRGRQPGDITRLFREGMAGTARVSQIEEVFSGLDAITHTLNGCQVGDLLLVQPDLVDDGVALVKKLLADGGREVSMTEAAAGPKTVVRESRYGRSIVAFRPIVKGEVVTGGWGPVGQERTKYTIQVGPDQHAFLPEPIRLINHSCEPNCGVLIRTGVPWVEVHALRDIAPGEELFTNYETFETQFEVLTGACLCGTPSCRGRLLGYSALTPAQKAAFGPYIAEYLRAADAAAAVAARPAAVAAQAD